MGLSIKSAISQSTRNIQSRIRLMNVEKENEGFLDIDKGKVVISAYPWGRGAWEWHVYKKNCNNNILITAVIFRVHTYTPINSMILCKDRLFVNKLRFFLNTIFASNANLHIDKCFVKTAVCIKCIYYNR